MPSVHKGRSALLFGKALCCARTSVVAGYCRPVRAVLGRVAFLMSQKCNLVCYARKYTLQHSLELQSLMM